MKQKTKLAALMAVSFLGMAALVFPAVGPSLMAQERIPGLTGADHADDVVMARQLLMDGVDDAMHDIDISTTGAELKLESLKANANTINMLLLAFPHLFPPQTKPTPAADGSPSTTLAQPAIWQNFEAFYGMTQAAAAVAYEASQADGMPQFIEQAKKLRAACDGCHAVYMHVEPPPNP